MLFAVTLMREPRVETRVILFEFGMSRNILSECLLTIVIVGGKNAVSLDDEITIYSSLPCKASEDVINCTEYTHVSLASLDSIFSSEPAPCPAATP